MAQKTLIGLSLLAHGAIALLIGRIEVRASQAGTAIVIAETQQAKKPPAPSIGSMTQR